MSNFKNRLQELNATRFVSKNPYAEEGAVLVYETLKTAKILLEDLYPTLNHSISDLVLIHDLLVRGETDIAKAKINAEIAAAMQGKKQEDLVDSLMSLTKKTPEGVS